MITEVKNEYNAAHWDGSGHNEWHVDATDLAKTLASACWSAIDASDAYRLEICGCCLFLLSQFRYERVFKFQSRFQLDSFLALYRIEFEKRWALEAPEILEAP